ncbi:MAG: flagellar biosynthesis protein FliQ [Lachnospiraceae bacterium]
MTVDMISDITKAALWVIIKTSAPVLLISLVVGLIVSVFQTVTSIQEQTLTFVPKIISIFIGIMLFGPWMMDNMTGYMTELWSSFSIYLK